MRVLIGCEEQNMFHQRFQDDKIKRPAGASHLPDRPNRNGSHEDHVMAVKALPSPEVLRQLLRYEPDTGKLFWKERPEHMFPRARDCAAWNARHRDKEAFTTVGTSGYAEGRVFRVLLRTHRVAMCIVNGEWPPHEVDHINGNPLDNRLSNLRLATRAENGRNQKTPSDSSSGEIGVSFFKRDGSWQARISTGGKNIHLGYFPTKEEAVAARKSGERRFGFHPNHGRKT